MRSSRLHVRLGIQPTTPVRSASSAVSDQESSDVNDQDHATEASDQGDETEEIYQEPEEEESTWPPRVTPVTQGQIDQANVLKHSIS